MGRLDSVLNWWNAVCGESRTHGVERGKKRRGLFGALYWRGMH